MKSFTERQAEVDRRVSQELKNNQDFIVTTNQWLQKLDLALQNLKFQLGEHTADVGSKLKSQDISIENLHSKNVDHKKDVNKSLEEYRQQMSFCLNFVKDSVHKSDVRFDVLSGCAQAIVELKEQAFKAIEETSRLENLILAQCIELNNSIDRKVQSLKKEIVETPSEVPTLEKQMLGHLDVIEVNFQGLTLEIERIKHKAFVSSKYIEDLYNKLSRIKKESQ